MQTSYTSSGSGINNPMNKGREHYARQVQAAHASSLYTAGQSIDPPPPSLAPGQTFVKLYNGSGRAPGYAVEDAYQE